MLKGGMKKVSKRVCYMDIFGRMVKLKGTDASNC